MRLWPFLLIFLLGDFGEALTNSSLGHTIIHEQRSDWQEAKIEGLIPQGEGWVVSPGQTQGVLLSAPQTVAPFDELIPSWNVRTWNQGQATLEVRVQQQDQWTGWYSFGRWSQSEGRTSVNAQADAWGQVLTDTLRLKSPSTTFQYRLSLKGSGARLSLIAINTSLRSQRLEGLNVPSTKKAWGKILAVPQRSQMVFPEGEGWCSPTSLTMIMDFHGVNVKVSDAARGMFDQAYEGTGNWPFNIAYAAEQGFRGFVTRLPNLNSAEAYIAAGLPLGVSLGWKSGELPGAPLSKSSGHLLVLSGFDREGNPVVNDPAAPNDEKVRRTYPRAIFERLWLSHSGGMAYVITPSGNKLP